MKYLIKFVQACDCIAMNASELIKPKTNANFASVENELWPAVITTALSTLTSSSPPPTVSISYIDTSI
ncbi:hypothetical protein D3C79_783270 [compost metagenome]